MKERIQNDIREALKAGEEIKVGTLRMVLAFLINKEKEKGLPAGGQGKEISDEEAMDVLQTEAKKRRESIEAFEKGGRPELAEKEKKELEILKAYLPEQLSEEEIEKLVVEAIEKTGATSMQDIGKIMGALMPQVKGKADGNLVNTIVKEKLTSE